MENIFSNCEKEYLRNIHEEILKSKETGIRPFILDEFIHIIQEKYNLTFSESSHIAENYFFEEVARRFFEE